MKESDHEELKSPSAEISAPKLDLFTDPNSPLLKAPSKIQDLFSK